MKAEPSLITPPHLNQKSLWTHRSSFCRANFGLTISTILIPSAIGSKSKVFRLFQLGAVEEMFLDTLINFMDVAKSHLAISLPVEIFAGLVAVNGFTLAVDRQYFGYEAFAGKILRQNVLHRDLLKKWTDDLF